MIFEVYIGNPRTDTKAKKVKTYSKLEQALDEVARLKDQKNEAFVKERQSD